MGCWYFFSCLDKHINLITQILSCYTLFHKLTYTKYKSFKFMASEKLPVITDEMIFALDQIFPNRHPDLSLSDREVWYRAGQRYVVDFLIEQQKRQKDTMLNQSVLEN